MESRQTKQIELPESKAKVTIYSFITGGENRQIRRKLLEGIKVDINPTGAQDANNIQQMPVSVTMDAQELALRLLVREIFVEEVKVENIAEFVENLSVVDSDLLYSEIDAVTNTSGMSREVKKK